MTCEQERHQRPSAHRTLNITYEAAWFMAHRIREAMRAGGLAPLGGGGKIVEADETYYGNIQKPTSRVQDDWPSVFKGSSGPTQASYRCACGAWRQCPHRFHVPVADKETVVLRS